MPSFYNTHVCNVKTHCTHMQHAHCTLQALNYVRDCFWKQCFAHIYIFNRENHWWQKNCIHPQIVWLWWILGRDIQGKKETKMKCIIAFRFNLQCLLMLMQNQTPFTVRTTFICNCNMNPGSTNKNCGFLVFFFYRNALLNQKGMKAYITFLWEKKYIWSIQSLPLWTAEYWSVRWHVISFERWTLVPISCAVFNLYFWYWIQINCIE